MALIGTLFVVLGSPIAELTALQFRGTALLDKMPLLPEVMYVVISMSGFLLFWALTRMPARQVGFTLGDKRSWAIALTYPLIVVAVLAGIAQASGAIHPEDLKTLWVLKNVAINSMAGIAVLLVEEGFFRGWLWGQLERSGLSPVAILMWTSISFALWHLPVVFIEPNYAQTGNVIPVYMVNAVLMGMIWGMLRAMSGSVWVSCAAHAVWNSLAYILFGYGVKAGKLGIQSFDIFGPERGVAGLLINLLVVIALWHVWQSRNRLEPAISH